MCMYSSWNNVERGQKYGTDGKVQVKKNPSANDVKLKRGGC
jgi:hypothetical protein